MATTMAVFGVVRWCKSHLIVSTLFALAILCALVIWITKLTWHNIVDAKISGAISAEEDGVVVVAIGHGHGDKLATLCQAEVACFKVKTAVREVGADAALVVRVAQRRAAGGGAAQQGAVGVRMVGQYLA
jgi:hypothetical protein